MGKKEGNWILIGMVAGAILGGFGGYFLGDIFIELKFLGTIFLNALKMIVVPLIVASMIVGVTSLGDVRKLGRTTGKTLLYYLATTGSAVLIGIILVNILQPGTGINGIGGEIPEFVHKSGHASFSDFIINLVPSNLIAAAAEGSVLPLIIFSLIFGGVLTSLGRKGKPVINFFVGLNAAIMKIVIIIIYFAPIGILAIIGAIVAENRGSLEQIVSGLGMYALTVIIGLLLHGVIILPLILKVFGRKDPLQYFINMGQALATAFTTASSSATLPVTMECVTEKNKVSEKASSFVLPLGATINMDGTALYEAVAAIFIAQAIGYPLTIEAQIIIFLTATLASIGAAAIPHAGLVTMVIVLSAVGLPLEGIGFIFAIDWFLDRCRTTVNVWGDSVGAAVIGETAEIKTYLRPPHTTTRTTRKTRTTGSPKKTRYEKPVRERKSVDLKRPTGQQYDQRRDERRKTNGRPRFDGPPRSDRRNQRLDERRNGRRDERSSKPAKPDGRLVSKPAVPPVGNKKPEIKKDSFQKSKPASKVESITQPKAVDTGKKTDDGFFDVKFSRINFFSDVSSDNKKTDDKVGQSDEKATLINKPPDIKPTIKPDLIKKDASALDLPGDSIPDNENKPSEPKPPSSEKSKADKPDEDNGDDDMWGRGRKKRPGK